MSVRRPGPGLSAILRAPGRLYDWHLGWLLGRRFLRLTHRGRRSGRHYATMLEVIGEDRLSHELFVVAGLGASAQWYRNLEAGGAIELAVGRERFAPVYRRLASEEAAARIVAYETRNPALVPVIRRVLSWLVGWRYDGSDPAVRRLVAELPVVGLRPAASTATGAAEPGRAASLP